MKGFLFISNGAKPAKKIDHPCEIDIGSFSYPAIDAANNKGYKLYLGYNVDHPEYLKCKQYDITYYNQDIYRNVFALKDNIKAYKSLCKFLDNHHDIEVINCNTPIGGVIGRICGHKYKKKVIYTVHGFHFYKGAPLLNWLLFYPIERFLLRWTDVLITINSEDYRRAQRFKLLNKCRIYYVPGVGVDLSRFDNVVSPDCDIRKELKLPHDSIVLVAVGRLDNNKNIDTIINGVAMMKYTNVHLIVCGEGKQRGKLETLIRAKGLQERVHLIGNRNDVSAIYQSSDIFVLASYREGLSRSVMEAMASGLPCVVSKIRGNVDLIDENGGFTVSPYKPLEFAKAFELLAKDEIRRHNFGAYNREKVKHFSLESSKEAFLNIFNKEL